MRRYAWLTTPDLTVFLGGACFNLTLPWTLSTLSALRGRGHHDLQLGRAPIAQAEGQVEKGLAWVGVKVEGPGASLAEGRQLASPFFGPQASPPECNNLGVPPEGCWVFLPTRRAGWHMASSSVPPRDPQAQTPFPSPPRARRMDFLDGARAPCGGCAEPQFSRWVRASSVYISHLHPWLSPDQLFGRLSAVLNSTLFDCQTLQKALRCSRKNVIGRRSRGAEGRQKPPDCQSGAGPAPISTTFLH